MMISRRNTEGIDEAPNDIENPYDPLLEDLHNLFILSRYDPLQEELDLLTLSPFLCIYRIPERIRQRNEKAYTPQVVSIGPLHHGKEHLKAMEEQKKRYLLHFLSRTKERVSYSDYIQMIKEQEGRLRGCYAEPIELGSDEFVRIVLVDAAFVIEYLLRYYYVKFLGEADHIVNKTMRMWDVRPDFLLLENQLPFFILQDLFNAPFPSSHQLPSLLEISYFSLQRENDSKRKKEIFGEILSSGVEVKHFVDLMRILYRPLKSKTGGELKGTAVPSVTELVQAGVEFKVGKGSNLVDINFSGGTLKIPKLTVSDTTYLKNLLAFELLRHIETNYVANYVFLMKHLAKTPKDVELLVEYGIIDNWLGDAEKIPTLLLDFDTGIMGNDYYYASLCKDLNDYCRSHRHKWMTNLRRNYFNTPWRSISVVAAVILLILTFIQTVCSIISIA